MFREMRRKKQALSNEENLAILMRGTSGVMAVSGDDDYPYAVPLSYVYHDSKIYFHCAASGHKLDAMRRNPKVSFCVIDRDEVIPQEYTTYFRSVIVFGTVRILEKEQDKKPALELLATKYSPDLEQERQQEISKSLDHVCMLKLEIEYISGKQAIELTQKRNTSML